MPVCFPWSCLLPAAAVAKVCPSNVRDKSMRAACSAQQRRALPLQQPLCSGKRRCYDLGCFVESRLPQRGKANGRKTTYFSNKEFPCIVSRGGMQGNSAATIDVKRTDAHAYITFIVDDDDDDDDDDDELLTSRSRAE
eukprot:1147694-Pelagomonas_calceolata.AAC.3